jgi:hypothetical protein
LPDLEVFIHVSQRMRFHWNVRSLCDHGGAVELIMRGKGRA